jgi:hypothetical protein
MKNCRKIATDALGSLTLAAAVAIGLGAYATPAAADEVATAPANRMSVPLAPDAPQTYVVKKGDTLWDISARYLTQPWYWPELWYVNPEIKNPHLIYPGDTLRLVYSADGKPQVRVERGNTVVLSPQVRTTPLDQSIPAIPYELVAAFMSKPTVISKEEAAKLPYVVAHSERRVIGGMGDVIYGRGIDAAPGSRFNVVHLGDKLKDPDDGTVLGWQGIYTGSARVDRSGNPKAKDKDEAALARLTIVDSARETLQGDRLVGESVDVRLDFVPHAPPKPIEGRVVAVMDGTYAIGPFHVLAINRGRRHGLEPGHVLQVWQRGDKVKDYGPAKDNYRTSVSPFAKSVQLPSERAGTFMVFRVYDRMSYGLVVSAETVMHVGDYVRTPTLGQ